MYENSVSEGSLYWGAVMRDSKEIEDSLVSFENTGLYRKSIGGYCEILFGEDVNGKNFVRQWDTWEVLLNDMKEKLSRLKAGETRGRGYNSGVFLKRNEKYIEIMD